MYWIRTLPDSECMFYRGGADPWERGIVRASTHSRRTDPLTNDELETVMQQQLDNAAAHE